MFVAVVNHVHLLYPCCIWHSTAGHTFKESLLPYYIVVHIVTVAFHTAFLLPVWVTTCVWGSLHGVLYGLILYGFIMGHEVGYCICYCMGYGYCMGYCIGYCMGYCMV